ncbi:hypothetical protein AB6A40_005623 [Gnathostoma spinigerum]|uniref:Uncharacterized protein n=1 Tax=Gnathostoma spinigerum TaxID=75299 RepID=A0ABD6EFY8_9BILA
MDSLFCTSVSCPHMKFGSTICALYSDISQDLRQCNRDLCSVRFNFYCTLLRSSSYYYRCAINDLRVCGFKEIWLL